MLSPLVPFEVVRSSEGFRSRRQTKVAEDLFGRQPVFWRFGLVSRYNVPVEISNVGEALVAFGAFLWSFFLAPLSPVFAPKPTLVWAWLYL